MSYEILKESIVSKLNKLNINLIIVFCVLFTIGMSTLYSASSGNIKPWFIKQAIYFFIFLPITILIALTDINFWFKNSYIIYFLSIFLLLLVAIIGHKSMGATRWINFGFIRIQPSEFMKIGLILALARYFFQCSQEDINNNKKLLIPILIFIIPFLLILKQPNLGTALILAAITISILFFVGVAIKKFIIFFILILLSIPFTWKFILHDYQKQRIITFINPDSDPLNSGYNIMQSKIAIGSGGIWGKGFLKGTQGQLEFLPEKHTDFIFTILCEEFGFISSLTVILLFLTVFIMMIYIITKCKHTFGRVIVSGIFINLFCHFFINIGMITGILPVVGTPLPLFSYGGSITATTLISLGFVLNVDLNKETEIRITI